MTASRRDPIRPGTFYVRTAEGFDPAPPNVGPPDLWVCRRLEDYPDGQLPTGAARATCARCAALIAFNPARVGQVPATTPKVCMQCAQIEPLPMTGGE